ncbi:MAG: hypothetical protein U0T75_13535 [Chitinophagales bacterium]
MTTVLVKRSREWTNRLRGIRIILDGVEVGVVKNGEKQNFMVKPGTHTLQARIDWCSSKEVQFTIAEDQQLIYSLNSFAFNKPYKLFIPFFVLYYTLIARDRYLELNDNLDVVNTLYK